MSGVGPSPVVLNALTIDVEDYYQVSAFERHVGAARWPSFESRVEATTDRLLALLDEAGTTATFFVLGWTAERFPGLVRRIAALGHEVACHSYAHRLVYELTPEEFRQDLRRARAAIESAAGQVVRGFRAPSFSITAPSLWALDVLVEEGFTFDSSIFPILHDRYGLPGAPRHQYLVRREAGSLWELPPSTVRVGRVTLPVAGGGYFRLFPYEWTRRAIARINAREGQPAVVYLHPWELDPDQPVMAGASALSRFRHYVNLSRTTDRLRELLRDFTFGPVSAVLADGAVAAALATLPGTTLEARRALNLERMPASC